MLLDDQKTLSLEERKERRNEKKEKRETERKKEKVKTFIIYQIVDLIVTHKDI